MQRNSGLLESNEIMGRKFLQIWAYSSVVEPLPSMPEWVLLAGPPHSGARGLGGAGEGSSRKKERKEGRQREVFAESNKQYTCSTTTTLAFPVSKEKHKEKNQLPELLKGRSRAHYDQNHCVTFSKGKKSSCFFKVWIQMGVMVHAFNLNIQKAEVDRSLWVS